MISVTPAVVSVSAASRPADPVIYRMAGFLFVVSVCSLFWMGAVALGSHLLGMDASMKLVCAVGGGVALVLTAVCAPIMLRT